MGAAIAVQLPVLALCACIASAFVPARDQVGEYMAGPPKPVKPQHFKIQQVNRKVEGIQLGVNYNIIPNTDLQVSQLCMGTATFGQEMLDEDAHKMLDMACKQYGINFLDTAEFFPHPRELKDDWGVAEEIVGDWLKKQKRESYIIANRVAGFSDLHTFMRGGETVRASKQHIKRGVEASLKRLQTDYIDLLYLGWPDRYVTPDNQPYFNPSATDRVPISFEEQVEAMNELIQEGKIRYYGVANETPWGIAKWHSTAKELGLKGPVAASNPYSLITKNDVETHLIEAVYHCNMSFIGYSPLCEGVLTGKYLDATEKVDGRLHNHYGHMVHLLRQEVDDAVFAHKMVADKRFIPLHAWALNYCITRPWVTSTCIGARNLKQLQDAILSQNVRIPEIPYADEDIELVYRRYTDPTRGEYAIKPLDDLLEEKKPIPYRPWDSRVVFRRKRERLQLRNFLERDTPDESEGWVEELMRNEPDDEIHRQWYAS